MADLGQIRKHLQEIYAAALARVDGRISVLKALRHHRTSSPLYVVAIGKAAPAMLRGALDGLGSQIRQGLLITKHGYAESESLPASITQLEAGHPWPDQASLNAGAMLLDFINAAPANAQLVFLISGGASSLIEVLPEGVSLEELRQVNHWLLGSGLDIHAMNRVRKSISCIKGGRLAPLLGGRRCLVLMISDVPGDDPATIGSGLLVPDVSFTPPPHAALPAWIEGLMRKGVPAPRQDAPCFDAIEVDVIASLEDAKRAASAKGRARGYDVYEHAPLVIGDAEMGGGQLASELLTGPVGLHVWGGETTVCLPPHPGRGGRNQQLALSAALTLEGTCDLAFLAAGTDGSDGPRADAGALVDGGTVARGRDEGLDPEVALKQADAGTFLAASGDLIQTGPTGTNVMDIILGLKV